MRCPYCHGPIENKLEYNLAPRHMAMVNTIMEAGPAGVDSVEFTKEHFKKVSPTTVRTTLNRLRKKVAPLKIVTRHGTIRITE